MRHDGDVRRLDLVQFNMSLGGETVGSTNAQIPSFDVEARTVA